MKKMLFFAAIALASLGSCTSDEFVGEVQNPNTNSQENGAISFTSGSKAVTRALSNSESAALLNNNFVLFGTKTKETTTSTVFNNYQANYVTNTAYTTESNSNNWEYVSYYNVPGGIKTNVGVTAFAATSGTTGNVNIGKVDQTIKYWDYSQTQYDFAAYSLGKGTGTPTTYATASTISFSNLTTGAYTLTGSADELAACYISDLVTAYNRNGVNDYGNPVQFSFRSLGTKIRIGFYETIPGYSVKDIQFYPVAQNGSASTTPTLFTSNAVLPSGSGTMTIKFPTTGWGNSPHDGNSTDYNKAHVTFDQASGVAKASTVTFDALTDFAIAEKKETMSNDPATGWIGRTSNAATYAGGRVSDAGKYKTILPYETGENLQLRIKYTLVSTDGSGEEINVDNATAVVPAELAKWNPNYAYTYIFKISDMTNGSTGVDGDNHVVTGLTPITLDAVVVDSEDGVQETITTVSTPSITTYAQGKVVTKYDEYIASVPVYIIVNNGTSNVELTVGTNANLYTVTQTNTKTSEQEGYHAAAAQPISEASVANAFDNGTKSGTPTNTWTVTDANNWNLVISKASVPTLTAVTSIDAADSPTGNAITVKGAKFTPAAAGTTYVFQYMTDAAVSGGTYTAETAATYNANLPGAISTSDTGVYSFTSYGSDSGTPEYGTGKVKVVSQANGWTTVLVIKNSIEGFVGNQYKVNATTMEEDTYYELYTTEGSATGIYVKISNSSFETTEVTTYNATLAGAVHSGQEMPGTPAKYQYKIIKIKE